MDIYDFILKEKNEYKCGKTSYQALHPLSPELTVPENVVHKNSELILRIFKANRLKYLIVYRLLALMRNKVLPGTGFSTLG